jgi:hypothetical protein
MLDESHLVLFFWKLDISYYFYSKQSLLAILN